MSQARVIRDGILERLQALEFFGKFHFSRSQSYQVAPEDLPYAAVYMMAETKTDANWNTGIPDLMSDSEICISVILRNVNGEELEDALDAAHDVILISLLTDADFMNLSSASKYKIEGLRRVRRQNVFGSLGSSNETPIGELRLDMTFVTRYDYPPNIRDDLKLVHLETVYPSLERAPATQQVIVPIDLSATDSPSPPWHESDKPRHYEWPINAAAGGWWDVQ
jgi:hypothetical protein